MWKKLGQFVIKRRLPLLLLLLAATGLMGYYASQVRLSYEFSKAIPTDNARFQEYQRFRQQFGHDGNLLVIGIQTDQLFTVSRFSAYASLANDLKKIPDVEDVLGVPGAVTLQLDSAGRLQAVRIFDSVFTQKGLDSSREVFENLPFYQSLLYNPHTHAYLMGLRIRKEVLASKERSRVIADISRLTNSFQSRTGIDVKLSGLPLIRTLVADRIQSEMRLFLLGSLALSVLTLLLFFRSFSTMLLSIVVVVIGVIWTLGFIDLCGYKITLLTALLPSLVVVIGIPNCIYFLNKYHANYVQSGNKIESLVDMVGKMGVVTLFCNLSAAIGFAVFAFTKSAILREFGLVAGLAIMAIFVISFILLPAGLSFLPPPGGRQLKYLNNKWVTHFLVRSEKWVIHHKRSVLWITLVVILFSVAGIARLKTVAFIVDDIPKSDKIYTDLKFFEEQFKGVMPLEIVIDTKRPNGLRRPGVFERVDTLSRFIATLPETNRPMGLSEGFRFIFQAYSGGDSSSYVFPNEKFVEEIMRRMKSGSHSAQSGLSRSLLSFMDSGRQRTRISVGMKDVGTRRLPYILDTISRRAGQIFDSSRYSVTLTGTSITFLEGSRYIIKGLKDSILWAFLLIALCMLYLFRSIRILVCSLLPNVVPLVVTAGIMGWAGVPLKPSTVLVFSVALGIAIDITIRFLVNYKQERRRHLSAEATVVASIHQTGLSIIYTSLVLIAGFVIFCLSSFGGTVALGWLTSVTLLVATVTNIILLPILILLTRGKL
jgi:hypothetical protein